MKKEVFVCDGECGKQEPVRQKRVKRGGYYGYYTNVDVLPDGWTHLTVNRKGGDVCSPECATRFVELRTEQMVAKAKKDAEKAIAKAKKEAAKAKDKLVGAAK